MDFFLHQLDDTHGVMRGLVGLANFQQSYAATVI
jgi:hypothetical protein